MVFPAGSAAPRPILDQEAEEDGHPAEMAYLPNRIHNRATKKKPGRGDVPAPDSPHLCFPWGYHDWGKMPNSKRAGCERFSSANRLWSIIPVRFHRNRPLQIVSPWRASDHSSLYRLAVIGGSLRPTSRDGIIRHRNFCWAPVFSDVPDWELPG